MSTAIIRNVLSVALGCTLLAAPAFAQLETRSIAVNTADLDLTTTAGERALHGRILRAVRSVCGDEDERDLKRFLDQRACRATALAKAIPQVQVAIAKARSRSASLATDGKSAPPVS